MTKGSDELSCPICEKKETLFFVCKNNCNLYRCQSCGLIFVSPINPDHLKIYQKDYFSGNDDSLGYADYEGDKEIMLESFRKYLSWLEKFCPQRGSLLDVGAATGNFVELANAHGWSASGMEISQYATTIGQGKGLKIDVGNFENENISADFFEAVTFWDVLEHFFEPEKAVRQAQKVLKSGGILAINTPDTGSFLAKMMGKRWHILSPPNHLNYFNRENLTQLLLENNFEVLYFGRIGKKFSLRFIFKVLANWQKLWLWRKISKYLMTSRMGGLKVSINTHDNLFLIARKKRVRN